MPPEPIQPPSSSPLSETAEVVHDDAFARKQLWKELPGNRYTPEELRQMSGEFADCTMHKRRTKVMFLD